MSEYAKKLIQDLINQWAIVLSLNICHSLEMEKHELKRKLPSILSRDQTMTKQLLEEGIDMMDKYDAQIAKQMFQALNKSFLEYTNSPVFGPIYSTLIVRMYSLFNVPYTGVTKVKALHTDQVLQQEQLSPFEELKCVVFEFLSNFFLEASKNTQSKCQSIKQEAIEIVFRFSEHDQPNAVRTAVGKIISATSVEPNHCNVIIQLFWNRFAKCKRDDDFRNFSALIDCIFNLHFSFETPEYTKVVTDFLKYFIDHSKKIERGVLRLKFLEGLTQIIKHLNQYDKASSIIEYAKELDSLWTIVLKWSNKGKHTSFCYSFLQNL